MIAVGFEPEPPRVEGRNADHSATRTENIFKFFHLIIQ